MEIKKLCVLPALLLSILSVNAMEDIKVMKFQHAGPYKINKPIINDSLDVNGKPFEIKNLLKASISLEKALTNSKTIEANKDGEISFGSPSNGYELHLLSFFLNSDRYVKGTLEVSAPGTFEVYVDNKAVSATSELVLEPRRYQVVIKYITSQEGNSTSGLKATFKSNDDANVSATLDPEKRYTMLDIIEGKDFQGISLSPNGKYALVKYIDKYPDGKSESYAQLMDATTGKILLEENGFLNSSKWMPGSDLLFYTRKGLKGKELMTLNPVNFEQNRLATNIPDGRFIFTPDESSLLYTIQEEGPKEDKDLIRVLEPADRIDGFRNRSFIWRYDLKSGIYEQLTFGHNNTYINDISADSKFLLFSSSERVYTSLPHSRNSLYKLDLESMELETIWKDRPYVGSAAFSPDGKRLLVTGSGDAFEGVGLNIKKGQISNTYHNQLFIYDLETHKATSISKEFKPSVMDAVWNRHDGNIYMLCEDEDYQSIYRYEPSTGKIDRLKVAEEVVMSYAMSEKSTAMLYYGQGVSNANRLYSYDLSSDNNRLIYDLSKDKLKDIKLGEVHEWNFKSDDGTTIQGRYYLPPHFDPNKKYPMIVYYYGGTSPTNRALEMRYSMHMYAAQGYVVYTLNPSGTTGFGQEFAARHVNAWGIKTADEIIKGTKLFCKEHSFVNDKKIGCIGASYGGFMTQYLQTRTDIFAAAISHAGISALSSYWGEGYWGYGYCSAANTGTYPWNAPEFFTKQSPLFNADKINTPILLIHGNADTNVPIGESIQMFAALKILGKRVEFVQVDGENHGIVGYKKRIGWQNSIYAWFAKWLKDEPEWWEALYPTRTL